MDRVFAVTFAGLAVVLLMIAMTVTPMYVDGPHLDYSFARSAHRYVGSESDLLVTIKADDTIYIGQNFVRAEELQTYLPGVCRITERATVIQSDRQASTKAVRNVLAAVSAAGVHRVTIMTACRANP